MVERLRLAQRGQSTRRDTKPVGLVYFARIPVGAAGSEREAFPVGSGTRHHHRLALNPAAARRVTRENIVKPCYIYVPTKCKLTSSSICVIRVSSENR